MKKRIAYFLSFLVLGTSALSCSLDEPLISDADKTTVFSSETGIKSYSWSL